MKAVLFALLNNIVVNRLFIYLGADHYTARLKANWPAAKLDDAKSLQQNMGFSHNAEVVSALQKVHDAILHTFEHDCVSGTILDIGCGVGLYLSDFEHKAELYGVDVSRDFLARAEQRLPDAHFYLGNYLDVKLERKFSFIYGVSVLQYFPPSTIGRLFQKLYDDLQPGGVLLLQYPHALRWMDCQFPDLTYVQYSPLMLEAQMRGKFDLLRHVHAVDSRPLDFRYDPKRYDPQMARSFSNGAILVARKK